METELLLLRETKVMQENKILELDSQRRMYYDRGDALRKQLDEVCSFSNGLTKMLIMYAQAKAPVQEVLAELGRKRSAVVKLEESLNKKLKDVERQSTKLKTSVTNQSMSGTAREAQLQSEVDKCMVRFCSHSHALDCFCLPSLYFCRVYSSARLAR